MNYTPELIVDAKAQLGEGPSWDARENRLIWVDILNQTLHRFDPEMGSDEVIQVDHYVGAAVPRESGGLMLVTEEGYQAFDPATRRLTTIVNPEANRPGNRFNDGKCDNLGRFWAGTMNMRQEVYAGSLYCLYPDHQCEVMVRPVTVSNGLAWSPDHKTMYYIDTPTGKVMAYDFDLPTGNIRNARVAVAFSDGEGGPDGMTSDQEGMLWVAHWGGWQISRWNPDTGERLTSIRLPASLVTSCCFGGSDMTDLYITTARVGLDDAALEQQPLAGGLFRVKTDVRGMPTHSFAG